MLFPPGISAAVSDPKTYTLKYPTPPFLRTYTEQFALVTCSPQYVAAAGASVQAVVGELAIALGAVPLVGSALAAIVEFGVYWYGHASLNQDGSLTLQFAYHQCGTKAGAIDITYLGVNADAWTQVVNALLNGMADCQKSGGEIERVTTADLQIHDNTVVAFEQTKQQSPRAVLHDTSHD